MFVPLLEIIAESIGSPVTSNKVINVYQNLVKEFENELKILTAVPTEAVGASFGEKLAEGIAKVRKADIVIEPGYDGVYGLVKIWPESKVAVKPVEIKKTVKAENLNQVSLFD
jgi:PHP family Zn ribbon phosphoesterase